jgi:hypothetical protein
VREARVHDDIEQSCVDLARYQRSSVDRGNCAGAEVHEAEAAYRSLRNERAAVRQKCE